MDWQTAINLGAGTFLAIVGFLARRSVSQYDGIRESLHDLRDSIQAFQLKVAEEYVKHSHLDDIKDTLRRIEDKLDGKADK